MDDRCAAPPKCQKRTFAPTKKLAQAVVLRGSGPSASLSVAETDDASRTWDFACFAIIESGSRYLGTVSSVPNGKFPSRVLALMSCPGAVGFEVYVRENAADATDGGANIEVSLAESPCCTNFLGVQAIPGNASGGSASGSAVTSTQLPPALGPQVPLQSLSMVQATGAVFATSIGSIAQLPPALGAQVPLQSLSMVQATGTTFATTVSGTVATSSTQLPATLGPAASAGSLSVVQATGTTFATTVSGTVATSSTQLPATLGPAASAGSLSVVQATGTTMLVTPPSGAGRLPIVASLSVVQGTAETFAVSAAGGAIAQLPTALGPAGSAGSLSVVQATGTTFATTISGTVAISSNQLPPALGGQSIANSFSVTPANASQWTINAVGSGQQVEGNSLSVVPNSQNVGRVQNNHAFGVVLGIPNWGITATSAAVTNVTAGGFRTLRKCVIITNSSTATYTLMIFDSNALPANGTAPLLRALLRPNTGDSAQQAVELDFGPDGVFFSNGVVLAISTTAGTLTISGTADLLAALLTQ